MADEPLHVLIAGAGVAGLEGALALHSLAEERVRVALVAPEEEFTYRPLAVAEPFRAGDVRRFPLRSLVVDAGATLTQGAVEGVDPERHVLRTDRGELQYAVLLLALGARPVESVPGAITFAGPADEPALTAVLEQARRGDVQALVFAVPDGVTWALPAYELALLTQIHLADAGVGGVSVEIVTPESAPLELFGRAAGDALRELLELRGVGLTLNSPPASFDNGRLRLHSGDDREADRVVALPRLEGPRLDGVPHDADGYVPTDDHGRVEGIDDVWAAGDLTAFPVKQGGLAAQQADAAAESIAARAGAPVKPRPFSPVLRGLLLTGLTPRYLRAEAETSAVDTEPLWWPPAKVVGRHLAPFLASRLGVSPEPPPGAAIEVEVELDVHRTGARSG
ncbi:MAG TPA: FAD/NAD(P)-binding oxidoreductase [Gaiellaceae bacterium]|nr:FAD/NAD(P)-binding oxidoreductase [Gaiellaceae bacterium]